jgi:hypothetical protein
VFVTLPDGLAITPLPSSLALMATTLGLAGAFWWRAKRRSDVLRTGLADRGKTRGAATPARRDSGPASSRAMRLIVVQQSADDFFISCDRSHSPAHCGARGA